LIADSPAEDVVDQYGRTWKVVRLPAAFASAPVPKARPVSCGLSFIRPIATPKRCA
jgi:hypothetical protein